MWLKPSPGKDEQAVPPVPSQRDVMNHGKERIAQNHGGEKG